MRSVWGPICLLAVIVAAPIALARTNADGGGAGPDPKRVARLLAGLRSDSATLTESVRATLERTGRWEPEGVDYTLWHALESVVASSRRASERLADGPPSDPAAVDEAEADVRELLESGREVDRVLARLPGARRLQQLWLGFRPPLSELSDLYGWDYDAGRFPPRAHARPAPDAGPADELEPLPAPEPAAQGPAVDAPIEDLGGVWHADPYDGYTTRTGAEPPSALHDGRGVAPRFTQSDDETVASALVELDHLVRTVQSRVDLRNVLLAAGGSDARDEERERTPVEIQQLGLEVDLTALGSAVADAQREFALGRRAADAASEAVTIVGLGHRVERRIRVSDPPTDLANAWAAVRQELNRLAVLYELERIPGG